MSDVEIEGVRVTHPDRVLFATQGATKRDIIDYYLDLSDEILPHIADRPLSLVRCPKGRSEECFFQKHAGKGFPEALRKITVEERNGKAEYMYVRDRAGLVAAVQMGVLEFHIWGARRDRIERPDRLVFDLDPDDSLKFDSVREAARELNDRLTAIGLQAFPMITGGKGVHVVLPLERRHGWNEHREFSETIAQTMTADDPSRYVATASKAKRTGKIFIDFLRNDRGSTAIAPYSTRAREGAPVAFPVSWKMLGEIRSPNSVTIADAAKRIRRTDPWSDYFSVRQRLPALEKIRRKS